jgi:phosphohistidine swiveling domain-containing protein
MKTKLQLVALIIPLIISANVAQAASCQNCTVTIISGLTSTAAVVTLEFSPSSSSTTQKFYPGETVTISVPADKCPLRLTGKIYSGYSSIACKTDVLGMVERVII